MRQTLAAAFVVLLLGSACSSDEGCTQDYDCPNTQVCNLDSGACEARGANYCDVDDDCPQATDRCDANTCVSQ
ncbi:MAG: hypothetical protein ACI9OJ_004360 [Myxococcota bacterium]|jgi:hypothetical protein